MKYCSEDSSNRRNTSQALQKMQNVPRQNFPWTRRPSDVPWKYTEKKYFYFNKLSKKVQHCEKYGQKRKKFYVGRFIPGYVLSFGTFCPLGRFVFGTFCTWDVLSLGPDVWGRFVLGRFFPWEVFSWDVLSVHPCESLLSLELSPVPDRAQLNSALLWTAFSSSNALCWPAAYQFANIWWSGNFCIQTACCVCLVNGRTCCCTSFPSCK